MFQKRGAQHLHNQTIHLRGTTPCAYIAENYQCPRLYRCELAAFVVRAFFCSSSKMERKTVGSLFQKFRLQKYKKSFNLYCLFQENSQNAATFLYFLLFSAFNSMENDYFCLAFCKSARPYCIYQYYYLLLLTKCN